MIFIPHHLLLFTATGVELFIAGESYAGFYIPWIAEHIVQMQLLPDADTGVVARDTSGAQVFT